MRGTSAAPRPRARVARQVRRLAVAALGAVAALAVAAPALAHPLGLPATARIVRTAETEVTVRWAAQPDDVVALAVAVGRVPLGLGETPEGRPDIPVDAALLPEDDRSLAASEELAAYVATTVAVEVEDGPCVGSLRRHPTVQVHGVEVVFACPGPADVAEVTIGLLQDLDDRYRTLAGSTAPDGEVTTLFGGPSSTHRLPLRVVGTAPQASSGAEVDGPRAGDGRPGSRPAADVGRGLGGVGRLDDLLVAAIERPAGGVAWLLGLVIAAGVGAVHALAPGHGKAIAAAYLVGERARRRDAVLLGSSVAAMHTGSVLVLGFALWRTVSAPDAARLGAAIEAVAGATFLTLGLWLVSTRRRDARAHGQGHGHEHGHDHGHDHGHAEHGHAGHDDRGGGRPHHDGRDVEAAGGGLAVAERAAPVAADSRSQRLVALGAAGGLLPSPSALAVLLTALFLDRLGYGLALVAAFSFGMAVVLSGVGLAVLAGRDLAARRLPARLHGALHAAPMLGAFAVVLLGGLVLARGLGRLL